MNEEEIKITKTTIPNVCNCVWCGGTMKRGGSLLSSRENVCSHVSYWCEKCGAVMLYVKSNNGKKIKNIDMEVKYYG